LPGGAVRSMLENGAGTLLLAGEDGQVLGSDDLGETWGVLSTTPTGETRALYEDTNGIVWAGDNGNILSSPDGGRTFSVEDTLPSGFVNSFIEETATDDLRAADNGQILARTFSDRVTLGRERTNLDQVMVGNLHRTANITDIKIDDGGVFSDIFPISSYPQALLPAVPAGNDALYLGIDTSQDDSGPLCNVIFDIATPASATISYALTWEYYNGSWVTLSVQDETNQLSEVGVKGVFWKQPSDMTAVAVDGVTGDWLRGRVSSLVGTMTPPTQQNRDIYSVATPFVEIERNQTTGNIDALLQLRAHNRSASGGPGGDEPQLYVNRLWCGVKATEDHANFRAYLNFADEQNPSGVSVDVSVDPDSATSIEADSNLSSATGKRVFFDASVAAAGSGLNNWEERVSINLGPAVARDFYGTYKAFLRLKQEGGSAGEVNVRLKMVGGSGGISYIPEPQETASTTDHELVMFDKAVVLPVSAQMTPNELGDKTSIIVEINTEAADADAYLYDLILIPTDEMWLDLEDRANTAESTVEDGRRLLVDSVTIPKFPTRAIVQNMASDSNISEWRVDGNGKLRLCACGSWSPALPRLVVASGSPSRKWCIASRYRKLTAGYWAGVTPHARPILYRRLPARRAPGQRKLARNAGN
jgi:hypothetical protein